MAGVQETPHSCSSAASFKPAPSQETQERFAVMYILENKGLGGFICVVVCFLVGLILFYQHPKQLKN